MNNKKQFRQKWLAKKSKFVPPSRSEEKTTPRGQIFRYFRYESRNNKGWSKFFRWRDAVAELFAKLSILFSIN